MARPMGKEYADEIFDSFESMPIINIIKNEKVHIFKINK